MLPAVLILAAVLILTWVVVVVHGLRSAPLDEAAVSSRDEAYHRAYPPPVPAAPTRARHAHRRAA